jgi:hypothetical protein
MAPFFTGVDTNAFVEKLSWGESLQEAEKFGLTARWISSSG